MVFDLSPLERAAARAGLPGLTARVVPHDRRRDRWFRWTAGELLVSEHVVDRCPPAEASALLVDAIFAARRLRAARWRTVGVATAIAIGVFGELVRYVPEFRDVSPGWYRAGALSVAGGLVFILAWGATTSAASRFAADDEAVELLGDPVPLVRGFNLMGQDELRVGKWRVRAKPDLHARAERLAQLHRLRERPHPGPPTPDVAAGG